ncbi:unnamed protein product [Alopecurus aequalis]
MAGGEERTTAGLPAEVEMDLDFSRWGAVPSFEFAFNSKNFSDRMLQLEVVACDDVGGQSLAGSARRPKEKADEEQSIDSNSTMAGTAVLTVKTLHINSAILAARSPFFLKLFSNDMRESDQMHSRIRIVDSEEDALMELLSFMYSGKLTTTQPTLVLDILMAADKFQVLSCMRHCYQLLTSLPMTTESALLYLDHPCIISMAAEVQHVADVAKKFLANKYKDLAKFPRELMGMPLAGIEAIFSSSDLHVHSEDNVYNFLLKWARKQYPESEERHKIWSSRLLPLVRFSYMSWMKLQKVLTGAEDDIDHEQATKHITDALLHKAYPGHKKGALAAPVPERAYIYKSLKVVEFERPYPQVIAYLDITREECSHLFPTGEIWSDFFYVAGWEFYLNSVCQMDENSKSYRFGFSFGIVEKPEDATCLTLDSEIAARTRPSGKFVPKWKGKVRFTGAGMRGSYDLFGVEWSKFIADDSLFIDGVLHLKVDLTVVEQPQLQT